jgi:hypothetical protein
MQKIHSHTPFAGIHAFSDVNLFYHNEKAVATLIKNMMFPAGILCDNRGEEADSGGKGPGTFPICRKSKN